MLETGTWVRLEGIGMHLDAIVELFEDVKRDDAGVPHLLVEKTPSEDYATVKALANLRLEIMNGAVRVRYPDHKAVRAGLITVVDPDGSTTNVITGNASIVEDGDRLGAEGFVGPAGAHPPPPSIPSGERLIAAAQKNDFFKRALTFYAEYPSWEVAHKILEVIEEANGDVAKKGWASNRELSDFTGTANNYHALGKDARHAKVKSGRLPSNKVRTSEQAQALIHRLMSRWSEELLQEDQTKAANDR